MRKLRYRHIERLDDVCTPADLAKKYPLTELARLTVSDARSSMIDILKGMDDRLIIMMGPCSVHDPIEAVEYAKKLKKLSVKMADKIMIIMRIYFEKPRTRTGWKGIISDPHLEGSSDFNTGLELGRKLLLEVNNLGMPAVTEFLGPVIPPFISDLVTTGTIGARTTESQTHREMASGLSMPTGFKNSTDGSIAAAIDALMAARGKHSFLGFGMDGMLKIVRTSGNQHGYLMLRGGKSLTNYDETSIEKVIENLRHEKIECKIVVDCSHGNSKKKHVNQHLVFRSVIGQVVRGRKEIAGLMLESNLKPGRQDLVPGQRLKYGISITDECIGWKETEDLVMEAYKKLS
ncbi:MAG: 3-deoxy-7-phosphoheptulonate synthase [Bacteroidota bacterium]|nr:3-deoxy-7-phosphoheptulonate synthase [Bacteroidota bacterium]